MWKTGGSRSFPCYGPTGALAETFQRNMANGGAQAGLTSATLRMVAIWLPRGITVTNVGFRSGTTAANGPTHSFTALYNSSRVLLSQSADQTTAAIGASTFFSYALGTPQPITATGIYYVAMCVVVTTTIPTTAGFSATPTLMNTQAPILSGNADGSLTATAPNPASAITADLITPYMYVS